MPIQERITISVFGSKIDVLTWPETITKIDAWARARDSRVVCISNAHSVVTARHDPSFQAVLNNADAVTPDGAPVALLVGMLHGSHQERINGPDLMWKYCSHAESVGQLMYFYGGSDEALTLLLKRLRENFPRLKIAGAHSPPFCELSLDQDEAVVRAINESGASVVWVGLGCPKQERWMSSHHGRVNAVMIGVGAAFDYHAGLLMRAPPWMQDHGLEWFYRLLMEPRRLWRRYLVTNTLFVWHAIGQLLRQVFRRSSVSS